MGPLWEAFPHEGEVDLDDNHDNDDEDDKHDD